MLGNYSNGFDITNQEPKVEKVQIDLMESIGFKAVKRDNSWILWELAAWPEVKIWLQNFQSDISQQYILMLVFKAGILNGKVFQCNEQRLSIGMMAMADEDVKRLSSFPDPWMAIDYNNHP